MNVWNSGEGPSGGFSGGFEEVPRGLKRTYRFPDGVRVMVWAYDVVVWVYPDGRQIQSIQVKTDR